MNTYKVQIMSLKSSWVMTCAFEQTRNSAVASGGLDNVCSIFQVGGEAAGRRGGKELIGHDGYISCCRFVTDKHILTSSGDSSSIYWDIERGQQLIRYRGHSADVMCLAEDTNKNIFATSSCDTTAKIWDIRTGDFSKYILSLSSLSLSLSLGACVQTFVGHESDVNSITFFPGSDAVGTGSDDATCRIFDMRCR